MTYQEASHRIARAFPASGRERRWQEIVDARLESVERQNPSGRRKLRHPDDVELQNVRRRRAGVEPLHVELMALIRRVGCDLQLHAHPGTPLCKTSELAPYNVALRSERAARERQLCRRVVGSAGEGVSRYDQKAECEDAPHAPSSRTAPGKSMPSLR